MGSRGAFDNSMGKTGGIPIEKREYQQVARVGKIKVIQCNTKLNNPTPIMSNTKNTTYYGFSKEHNKIEHIFYYRNHQLYKSVDFKEGEIPHSHYWPTMQSGGGRKSHDKKNIFNLSDKDIRLMKNALIFNTERNG